MNHEPQQVTAETTANALAKIIEPLDALRASSLRETFGVVLDRVEAWQVEARSLTVTAEDQVGKMKRARLLRLEIKDTRVALDKKRKELKAGLLIEERAIDGAFAVFRGFAVPLEDHLAAQEEFAERAETARRNTLRDARQAALTALGFNGVWVLAGATPTTLGELSETEWGTLLADAQAAQKTREEAARVEAEQQAARDAARKQQEQAQREENERLQAEIRKTERGRQVAEVKACTAQKAVSAGESKLDTLATALRKIAANSDEPIAAKLARKALKDAGIDARKSP